MKEVALTYAQHNDRIKPPSMVVDSEIEKFRFQPRK